MMELYRQDILVIDCTHDMTQYGCQLLNIMGVDEYNKGYPLAHCVSNKMDAATLQHFFKAIKLKCPTLEINCIITDDDPALINAANMGFGQGDIKHILCLWHFKRTLQRNLHAKVRNSSLEKEMFHHPCTIVDSEKEVEFRNSSESSE
uniref:MULE transposase domain-containing protein n=1 Tax=Cacopsylla melanoneura TaxID=428564 RepID=A0A8D8X8L3_9HEMI